MTRSLMTDPLLLPEEVCARLRISRRHLYRLVERGDVPHLKISNHLRFVQADLDDWLARQRVTKGEPCSYVSPIAAFSPLVLEQSSGTRSVRPPTVGWVQKRDPPGCKTSHSFVCALSPPWIEGLSPSRIP